MAWWDNWRVLFGSAGTAVASDWSTVLGLQQIYHEQSGRFQTLQGAVDAAQAGGTVWEAGGTVWARAGQALHVDHLADTARYTMEQQAAQTFGGAFAIEEGMLREPKVIKKESFNDFLMDKYGGDE